MKTFIILLFVITASCAMAQAMTLEDFRKLSDQDQIKAFEEASPEQQKEFNPTFRMTMLKLKYGGEEGLRFHDYKRAIAARGMQHLILMFLTQEWWRELHIDDEMETLIQEGNKIEKEKGPGFCKELGAQAENLDTVERKKTWQFFEDDISLLLKIAPTPEAMAMEEQARKFDEDIDARFPRGNFRPLGKERLASLENFVNDMRQRLKALPQLTPEEVDKELNSLPEEELMR